MSVTQNNICNWHGSVKDTYITLEEGKHDGYLVAKIYVQCSLGCVSV
jgi:hypothetical protein